MNINEIVGGKWWKFDFHIHTPGSYDYDNTESNISPLDYLKCCMKKELDCIVVTDHNTFQWIPELRKALTEYQQNPDDDYRDIVIFPGIEITVQGNIHLLGIFDPGSEYEDLVKILGKIDYCEDIKTTKNPINKIIEIITENHGIAVPAHVDQASGLFYEDTSSSVQRSALDTRLLLALEVINSDFHNAAYEEFKLNLSYVSGSDAHRTDDIARNYTWIKMGEANIEALRLALYDGKDSSIRSIDCINNPNNILGRTYIKRITISNGKIIGRIAPFSIDFSPWHNCLIGGRGSGKSSILKLLRLILNRQSELSLDLRSEFDKFAKIPANREDLGILLNNTEITLDMVVDGVNHRLLWKNGKTYEIEDDDSEIDCLDITKRFPVKMFSQKQLFELTKNANMLIEYIDEDWDSASWNDELKDLKLKYKECKNSLAKLQTQQHRRKQLTVELEDLNKKISVFETEETKQLLADRNKLTQQQGIIGHIYDEYADLIAIIENIKKLKENRIINGIEKLDEDTQKVLTNYIGQFDELHNELKALIQKYAPLSLSFEDLMKLLPIKSSMDSNTAKLNELLSVLLANGVEGIDKYKELIDSREVLQNRLSETPDVSKEIEEQEQTLKDLLHWLKELIKKRYDERCSVIERYNGTGNLRIKLNIFADIEGNEKEFRRIIQRESGFDSDILVRNSDDEMPTNGFIYKTCCINSDKSAEEAIENLFAEKSTFILSASDKYSRKFVNYLEKARERSPEIDIDTMLWIPDDKITLDIKLPGNRFQSVDSSSPGQRTSAILSLILRRGKYPIIIDQPEDDLDTRNITDIVVKGISEMKNDHQFIIVTHNPNIVVNTNSEQVIQLDVKGGQIQTQCSGALQSHDVRDAICEVMEGGREALEKRYFRIIKALS